MFEAQIYADTNRTMFILASSHMLEMGLYFNKINHIAAWSQRFLNLSPIITSPCLSIAIHLAFTIYRQ